MSDETQVQSEEVPVKRDASSRKTTALLLGLTGLGALVFLGSVGGLVWLAMRGDTKEIAEDSFLRVTLAGSLTDAPGQGGLLLDPADAPLVTAELARGIRAAASDERIGGLYLEIDNASGGWGSWQELRGAVAEFSASGKPCVAYSESFGNGSYYLASACDTIVINPSGVSLVNGLAMQITYYRDTLDKIGVEPRFEHVGDFKSAVEPFERTGPSDAAAQAHEAMLDSLYAQMIAGIAAGRSMAPEAVIAAIDGLAISPQRAMEAGLVDAVAFPDAVVRNLRQVGDPGWVDLLAAPLPTKEPEEDEDLFTSIRTYLADSENSDADGVIAVVYAEGSIVSGDGEAGLFAENTLADGEFRDWMREVREDEDVKAVVLRVNSPGGSGLASDNMWREVERVKATGRPVVVSMGDYAASGGYFISAPADFIVAQPGTITGSIGVFGGSMAIGGLYEKLGLHQHTFKRGALADFLSPTGPYTPEAKAVFQGYLANFYDHFVGRVVDGRKLERDAVHAVAQGRVWTGEQALAVGLVDDLGGMDVALAKAAEIAKMEDYRMKSLPRERDFMELIMEDLATMRAPTVRVQLPAEIPEAELSRLFLLEQMTADGAVAWWPGQISAR